MWKHTRSKRQLLHHILFVQQDSTGRHHQKFDIQVDENTKTQVALLHDDIPGYDLPTIDFVQTSTDNDEDISILEEDNSQIYAHLTNVLVHMIDN